MIIELKLKQRTIIFVREKNIHIPVRGQSVRHMVAGGIKEPGKSSYCIPKEE